MNREALAKWLQKEGFILADAKGNKRTPFDLLNARDSNVGVLWQNPDLPTRKLLIFHREPAPIFLAVIYNDDQIYWIRVKDKTPGHPERIEILDKLKNDLQIKVGPTYQVRLI